MPEREEPKVVLRGPAEGESIIRPMGGQRAHMPMSNETHSRTAIGRAKASDAGASLHI